MAKAILRAKETTDPKDRELHLRIPTPVGSYVEFHWHKGNDFTLEVPTNGTYRDNFGKDQPFVLNDRTKSTNIAQHFLDSYPQLELLEIKEEPVVDAPIVVDRKKDKHK